jgi:tRNA G37 N-methylase TrmD
MRTTGTAEARAVRITLAYLVACVIVAALVRFYDGIVYQDDSANDESGDVVDVVSHT